MVVSCVLCAILSNPEHKEATHHRMQGLITILLEIQVMVQRMIVTIEGPQHDLHVELAPSFLLEEKRCFLDDCCVPILLTLDPWIRIQWLRTVLWLRKGGVQVICRLVEDVGCDLVAGGVQEVD